MSVEDPRHTYSPYARSKLIRIIEIPLAIGLLYLVMFSGLNWEVQDWLESTLVADAFFLANFLVFGIGLLIIPTIWKLLVHPLGRCWNCGKSPLHTSPGISEWIYLKHPWQSALTRNRFWPETECSDCRVDLTIRGNLHDQNLP